MAATRTLLAALAGAALLAGCGGGGDAGPLVPTVAEDTVPAGTRLDVSALDLFPLDAGDTWHYDLVIGGQAGGTVTRAIVAGPDANGWFTLREGGATQTTDVVLRQTIDGIEQADPLGVQQSMPGAYALLPTLVIVPMPFYPAGGVRRIVRQGDAQADLDGDGWSDGFRVEITQVFRGFEAQDVLGQPAQVAHFSNVLAFTTIYSRGGSYTTTTTEETWLASGLGMVRTDRAASGSDGAVIVAPYTLVLHDAAIAPLP